MGDKIFGSECSMDEIGVPLLHNVTDELGFGDHVHHIMTTVVVEVRNYDVAIAATEFPCLACV